VARIEPKATKNAWLQASQLPRSLAFYPPCNFLSPGMPQALVRECRFVYKNNMLYITSALVPQQPQPGVAQYQSQYDMPGAMVPYQQVFNPYQAQYVMPQQLAMPPFAYTPVDYNSTGYAVPMYPQPQMQIMCKLTQATCEEQQQVFAQRQ